MNWPSNTYRKCNRVYKTYQEAYLHFAKTVKNWKPTAPVHAFNIKNNTNTAFFHWPPFENGYSTLSTKRNRKTWINHGNNYLICVRKDYNCLIRKTISIAQFDPNYLFYLQYYCGILYSFWYHHQTTIIFGKIETRKDSIAKMFVYLHFPTFELNVALMNNEYYLRALFANCWWAKNIYKKKMCEAEEL